MILSGEQQNIVVGEEDGDILMIGYLQWIGFLEEQIIVVVGVDVLLILYVFVPHKV